MTEQEDQAALSRSVEELADVIRTLRGPDGCPWDREQTHHSLKSALVEECAELLDAIDAKDDAGIREELGDVLLHVIFHADIAEGEGRFSLDDVVRQITAKLKHRHPHVFGGGPKMEDPARVIDQWQAIKRDEKARRGVRTDSVLDGVPRNLPALTRACQIQRKAAKVGFDWPVLDGVIEKLQEEILELRAALQESDMDHADEEIGDILFSLVNFCRFRDGKTAEALLHEASDKFERRFRRLEETARRRGTRLETCSIEAMESLWREVKAEERA